MYRQISEKSYSGTSIFTNLINGNRLRQKGLKTKKYKYKLPSS